MQPGQPQPHPPPFFFRFRTAKQRLADAQRAETLLYVTAANKIQSTKNAKIRTPMARSYRLRIANTANAARYATQHCESAMIPARTGEPTSRRMAAMAATQGV